MAQNISLLGANYSAVPAVQLPKTGGGTATFTDVTDTTAEAADVLSGKYFYTASGVKTEGTSSGGGTTILQRGVMRPDATLEKTYSFDQYLKADLEINPISYTTTSTTLVAAANLSPTYTCDFTNYSYYVLIRMATIPEYSITTKGKGREEYALNSCCYEITEIPANSIHALVDTTKYITSVTRGVYQAGNNAREVYYSSSSALAAYNSAAYGYNQTVNAPSLSSSTLTLKSPALIVRGNTTYFVNTYMNAVTDVRYQYVIEVWRAPKNNLNLDGWGLATQWDKMNEDILSSTHKLT